MENCTVTGKELREDYKAEFITAEFTPKELIQHAIIKEKYDDNVKIVMTNSNSEDCEITIKISEMLTEQEFIDVINLNNGM